MWCPVKSHDHSVHLKLWYNSWGHGHTQILVPPVISNRAPKHTLNYHIQDSLPTLAFDNNRTAPCVIISEQTSLIQVLQTTTWLSPQFPEEKKSQGVFRISEQVTFAHSMMIALHDWCKTTSFVVQGINTRVFITMVVVAKNPRWRLNELTQNYPLTEGDQNKKQETNKASSKLLSCKCIARAIAA